MSFCTITFVLALVCCLAKLLEDLSVEYCGLVAVECYLLFEHHGESCSNAKREYRQR